MKVITLLNEKGGVGKTTLSLHVAAGCAIRGDNVVLIDGDSQGSGAYQLLGQQIGGFYNVFARRESWNDNLHTIDPSMWSAITPKGSLHLLPGNHETMSVASGVTDVRRMHQRIQELKNGGIDTVVIDTPPTPSLLHAMFYIASDYYILPTQCQLLSLYGLVDSIDHLDSASQIRVAMGMPPSTIIGIQPNLYDERLNNHALGLKQITDAYSHMNIMPKIHIRATWMHASSEQKTVFAYAPKSDEAKEAWTMIDHIQQVLNNE